MNKTTICNKNCLACKHYGFCQVYWGKDCKRQGGKKIPRMKSRLIMERQTIEKPVYKKMVLNMRENNKSRIDKMPEPIMTKLVNW